MLLHLLINTLIVGSGYGLVAMAFRLMNSVSPFFNMTIGAIAVLGGYVAYWLLGLGLPLYLVIVAALLASVLFSSALEIGIYTPMRKRGASSMVLMVASLGVYTIFESVIHLIFGSQYQTLGNVASGTMISLGSIDIPLVQLLTIIASFIVWIFLNYFLQHTFMGKKIRAVNDSSTLATIIGLKNNQIILIVSALTGVVLGLDGILVGYDTGLEPTMGFNLLFKGMIGAIIGGVASLNGAFFGAIFLAFAENVGVALFASEWRDLISFVIFITFLSLRPQGIFQKKEIQ
ncbi:MAG: branched-chain amino acid ABC transporter permease [Alphaproteobacteria bacterium]|nr:branched-chain amino acid ABC transporter permease [Alphaproteobacteria bacterium]